MRNRAKCKLCEEIIESLKGERVSCKCKQIEIEADETGEYIAHVYDWAHFLRVNDDGSEVPVKILDDVKQPETDVLFEIEQRMKDFERLPWEAGLQPMTQTDMNVIHIFLVKIIQEMRTIAAKKDQN